MPSAGWLFIVLLLLVVVLAVRRPFPWRPTWRYPVAYYPGGLILLIFVIVILVLLFR